MYIFYNKNYKKKTYILWIGWGHWDMPKCKPIQIPIHMEHVNGCDDKILSGTPKYHSCYKALYMDMDLYSDNW